MHWLCFMAFWTCSVEVPVRKPGLKFNVKTLLPMAEGEGKGLQITLSPNGG